MKNHAEYQYFDIMRKILDEGIRKKDRTGVGTYSLFGCQIRHDFKKWGFPLLTTKRMFWRGIVEELLWFLRGETNISYLEEKKVSQIWKPWADENGEVGKIYPFQWRNWGGQNIDQIKNVLKQIKEEPDSRRHLISAWNVGDLNEMKLPPCHYSFQFYAENHKLNISVSARSSDVFIGLPWNIAFYSVLLYMFCHLTKYDPGQILFTSIDCHVYANHVNECAEQLKREPRILPELKIKRNVKDIDDFKYEDFELIGYNPYPPIKAEVAV